MERSDGWSNSSVDGSSEPMRSLSRYESSVPPTESSPADISGTSIEIAVPVSDVAVPISTSMRPRGSQQCARVTLGSGAGHFWV